MVCGECGATHLHSSFYSCCLRSALRTTCAAARDDPRAQAVQGDKVPLVALNVALAMVAIGGVYMAPMYLVGHWYRYAGICFAAFLVAVAALKFHTLTPGCRARSSARKRPIHCKFGLSKSTLSSNSCTFDGFWNSCGASRTPQNCLRSWATGGEGKTPSG